MYKMYNQDVQPQMAVQADGKHGLHR